MKRKNERFQREKDEREEEEYIYIYIYMKVNMDKIRQYEGSRKKYNPNR